MGPQGHPYSPYGSTTVGSAGGGGGLAGLHHGSSSTVSTASATCGSIPLPVTLGGGSHHNPFASPHHLQHHQQHPSLSFLPRKPAVSSLDFLTRSAVAGASPHGSMVHGLPTMAGLPGLPPGYLPSPFFGPAGLHHPGYRHPLLPSLYSLPTPPTAAAHHSFQTLLASLSNHRPKLSNELSPTDYQSLLSSLSSLHQQHQAASSQDPPPGLAPLDALPPLHALALPQVFSSPLLINFPMAWSA